MELVIKNIFKYYTQCMQEQKATIDNSLLNKIRKVFELDVVSTFSALDSNQWTGRFRLINSNRGNQTRDNQLYSHNTFHPDYISKCFTGQESNRANKINTSNTMVR